MKWLSIWRQRKGLTQTQLSDKSGIDSNMISRYERGTATPTLETVKRLAFGLGITVDELLNEPRDGKIELLVSWDWSEMKKGEIRMSENKFKLILGEDGMVGLNGAGKITSREAIEEFLSRVRNELEIALDAQMKRGVIPEA